MEDVARQVGIGKGTIYLHFKSKEEAGPEPHRPDRRDGRPEAPGAGRPAGSRGQAPAPHARPPGPRPLRRRRPLHAESRRPAVVGPGAPARPAPGPLREGGGRFRGGPAGGREVRVARLPRSPDGRAGPHPEHEFAPAVQPVARGARPPGRGRGPGRPHRRPARQGTSRVPVASGQLDALTER
ncbi:MAG: TetR/AcrR family transcriptional regulator [Ignavibacteriales bacterium]|nr:TetR/AcrR family transcriptional regulator [Ignavibacteriales bacterium]